jgi:hypothetical protein
MNVAALFIPSTVSVEKRITLEKNVSAMEIVRTENVTPRLGAISVIPKGYCLEVCGSGFNERTYKVRCEDRFFFVFRQDVDPVSDPMNHFTASS